MAPKRNAKDAAPASTAAIATAPTLNPRASSRSTSGAQQWDKVIVNIYDHYQTSTPQRTKLIDIFMAFLVAAGGVQFLYCVLAGNFPFNAFLSGFGATVGQFVLAASLRIQTTEANKSDFPSVSPERAFADFIVCSLILHFFCINFIN